MNKYCKEDYGDIAVQNTIDCLQTRYCAPEDDIDYQQANKIGSRLLKIDATSIIHGFDHLVQVCLHHSN